MYPFPAADRRLITRRPREIWTSKEGSTSSSSFKSLHLTSPTAFCIGSGLERHIRILGTPISQSEMLTKPCFWSSKCPKRENITTRR